VEERDRDNGRKNKRLKKKVELVPSNVRYVQFTAELLQGPQPQSSAPEDSRQKHSTVEWFSELQI